jgi:hypothetical protein
MFPLRIGYIDKILRNTTEPILELTLNSTMITSSECLIIAANERVRDLRILDLSNNPISV